jgi:hypothetical protein
MAPGEVGLAVEDSTQERRPLEGSTREHRPVQVLRITATWPSTNATRRGHSFRAARSSCPSAHNHVPPAPLLSALLASLTLSQPPAFVPLPSCRTIQFLRRTAVQGCVLGPLCAGDSRKQPRSKETSGEHSRRSIPVSWACQDLNLGPHPYQACSSYAVNAASARDGQLSCRAQVTVVVRSTPCLAARCGTRVARTARTNVVRTCRRRHQLACTARPVMGDHLPRWQASQREARRH